MAAAWDNNSDSDSESSSSEEEEEKANLAFMANIEDRVRVLELAGVVWRRSWWLGSCGSTTRSSSSSLFVCCNLHKPPSWSQAKHPVSIWQFWTAIQEHVLALSESGAVPVNATAR
ncbi:hypothetical protein Taro_056666 [Colocasia esculenta]|uniref:Uncharacterized protein n=1 Tax=Colocasia esculenta TaxID=4460 RepID=A0A843XUL3_COLES|nr:hypothetical protein [Colocasia esculenta]